MRAHQIFTGVATLLLAPSSFSQQEAEAESATEKITVTLVEQGAKPRRQLRFQFQPGHQETALMRMDMTSTMTMEGQVMPIPKTPAILQTFAMQVDRLEEGIATCSYRLEKVELEKEGADAAMAAAIGPLLGELAGMTGTISIDNRGFNRGSAAKLPEGASLLIQKQFASIEESLSNISSPLPAKPVGVGAMWKVEQPVALNGAVFDSVATYTITELTDHGFSANVVSEVIGEDVSLDDAAMRGAKVTILKMAGTGQGQTKVDLTRLNPISTMQMMMDQEVEIETGGQIQNMETQLNMQMDMNRVEAAEQK